MKRMNVCTTLLFTIISCFVSLSSIAQGLLTLQLQNFKVDSKNGNVALNWKTTSEQNLLQFEVEYSDDGRYYRNLGFIPARNSINGNFYEFEHSVPYSDSAFYRLKVVDNNRKWIYSDPLLYHVNNTTAFFVYPSVITTHILNIFLEDPFYSLEVVTMNGNIMLKQNLSGKTGRINVPLSSTLSPGIYVIKMKSYDKTLIQRVVIQ